MSRPTIYQIPVCPFCQRLEILLTLKGVRDAVDFHVVDITQPRPEWLLKMTRGTTALPVLRTADGQIIKESLVIMQYFDDLFSATRVAQSDPYRRAVENMMTTLEGPFGTQGYVFVMNQDPGRRAALRDGMLAQYARLNDFLVEHAPDGTFLFESFGWAEAVFTPLFMRFWFLEYYEDFELPDTERYAGCGAGARPVWRTRRRSRPRKRRSSSSTTTTPRGRAMARCCPDGVARLSFSNPTGATGPGRPRTNTDTAPRTRNSGSEARAGGRGPAGNNPRRAAVTRASDGRW